MKDLIKDSELQRYRTDPLHKVKSLFKELSPTCELYEFAFPLEGEVIRTLISKDPRLYTKISVSIQSPDKIRPIHVDEMYQLRSFLLNPEESLAWTYSSVLDKKRSTGFRNVTGNNFDMTDLVMQLMEFTGEMPPLEEAYNKKPQKNKGLFYNRGTIGGKWQFAHAIVPGPEPWIVLKEISDREFKGKKIAVLFNEETKKHPCEYVLWVLD